MPKAVNPTGRAESYSIITTTKMNNIRILLFLIVIVSTFFYYSCNVNENAKKSITENSWENLVDNELSNWDKYLSFKHQIDYDGTPPLDESNNEIKPIGLNKPGYDVFTTIEENEEVLIKVSGEYYGCLATKKEYENYHFQLQYRWGEKKWIPRIHKMKDSGILYHSIGDFGVEHWRSWMMSQEFQIMEAHTGDFWNQATSAIDIRAYASESGLNPMAHESQEFMSFGEKGEAGSYCLRSNNNEKPHGEWNTLDLICLNGKSLHIVNGKVVMVLKNSRYINENGEAIPLTKGKIQLQSEAAELYFKGIKIRPIEKLAPEHLTFFQDQK